MKYPYTAPSASSACSDRIPLHASATSRVVDASVITFPSRSTGIPAACMQNVAVCAAKSCSGNATAFITIAGSGIMNTRNARGKASSRRNAAPRISQTSPASTTMKDERCRNSSAPTEPTTSITRPNASSPAPHRLGFTDSPFSRSRPSHTK